MSAQPANIEMCPVADPVIEVEMYLNRYLSEHRTPNQLREAVRYVLLGGGKRVRPVLVVRSCEAVGADGELAMPAAAAIELIHNFSLVHDDLPAMDDDDLRRGRPTLHRHTNEATAILAGDLMIGLAFELIGTDLSPDSMAGAITRELASATNDMIAGQVHDTLPAFAADVPLEDRLVTVHRNKTAALIRCACRMGAFIGDADDQQLEAITRYAEAIGLMFQVVDDLLDVTQTTNHLGKRAGKDAREGKLTYPGLLGIDATRAVVQRLRDQALTAIQPLSEAASPLRDLCEQMAVRTK